MKEVYIVKINDDVVATADTFSEAYEKAHTILEENNSYTNTVIKYCSGEPFKRPTWHDSSNLIPAMEHVEKNLELEIHVLKKASDNEMEQFTGNVVQIKKVNR
jgi:hypothetical protein